MLCGLDFFYYFITDALELPLVVRLLYAQTFLIMLCFLTWITKQQAIVLVFICTTLTESVCVGN